jgi:putative redox protein
METKVSWKSRLSFSGANSSGFNVPLGTDAVVGGDNDGFRPMELIAIGLAGCTAMDTISILLKKRQEVTAFEVLVHAERAEEHPKVFTNITLEYLIEGHEVDPAAVERAIELSATKYCPAQAMLEKAVKIEHKYSIKEAV